MGEPAKKYDIEPDIRPFEILKGGLNDDAESKQAKTSKSLNDLESKPEGPAKDSSILDREGNPWVTKVAGGLQNSTKKSLMFKLLGKNGPLLAIVVSIILIVVGIIALLSPSLLLVQFKETMVNKFNTQLASMDVRTTKILSKKMGTTSGVCGSVLTIKCKYSTMSKKQLAKFDAAGIKVNYEDTSITGRAKPTSFEFEGKTITASDFTSEIKDNVKFRSAVKESYNPKYAGFADTIWNKVKTKLGISEKAVTIDGDTDAEKLKSIQDDTKTPKVSDDVNINDIESDSTDETVKNTNKAINEAADEAADEFVDQAQEVAESGAKASSGVLSGILKVTGPIDTACTAYTSIRAVGFAAKTVRALQLARYAMLFLNVADQIKAGTARSEDVEYLGKILTTEFIVKDASGKVVSKKTATDSFGYRYAAYNEKGKLSTVSSQFLAGGGLAGDLINVTSIIDGYLNGNAKGTCKFLANPVVSGVSTVVGVALMFTPAAAAIAAKDVAVGVLQAALGIAVSYLPALLQDIVAGVLIDDTTVGEAAGDAITSGSSGIMSNAAKAGGNAPLTPEQAVAYNNLSKEVADQYAEEDQLAYSPFDITNSNTFMGKIFSTLVPYLSNLSSLSGILSSVTSITTDSIASITTPNTYAVGEDDYKMCQDYDYNELGLATDPYCNVIYGIPTKYLDTDPDVVYDKVSSQIDTTTGEALSGSAYSEFLSNCINRSNPLGDTGSDGQGTSGSECLVNNENKDFYLFYVDQRVANGMEE